MDKFIRKKYANPPIAEAVCEFRLPQDSKWDLTTPGLFYERTRATYPKKNSRLLREVAFKDSREGIQQQIRQSEQIRYLTNDEKAFIQIGTCVLSIHCLKPYPTWEDFKPRIEDAYITLNNIVPVQTLQRIGLRYINRIEIPKQSVSLESYFGFRPYRNEKLPNKLGEFIVGCSFPFSNGRDSCKVQLTNLVADKPDTSAFLLDLDYFLNIPIKVSECIPIDWIENAHQKIEEIFEGCITDQLREIFKLEK